MPSDSVLALRAGEDPRAAALRLRRAHEQFVLSRRMPVEVRAVVASSWHRCAAARAPHDGDRLPALRIGADHVVNARMADPVKAIQELGGADVAIALATSPRAFEQAFGSLRRGGRLVCVALPADDKMTIPIFDTVLGGKTIIGSIIGTRKDLTDVLALHAAGRTKVAAEERQLEDVSTCIADVLAGHVPARLVFMF